MAEKLERGRFTLRLNENDPAHEKVISVLEQQGARGKSRYIVNAILHYVNCSETPDILVTATESVDRKIIESIVLDILKKQGYEQKITYSIKDNMILNEPEVNVREQTENDYVISKNEIDDATINLIQDTLSSFRTNM